jgi:formylglycine-generating enzyme required for sulfatase activity
MHGNVREWCEDWYRFDFDLKTIRDPKGPAEGKYKVARGGSWTERGDGCRSSARRGLDPATRAKDLGFRIVLEAVPRAD